jgi:hypothetical protein
MKVPSTYFCAYDDFIEIHRAAFEDAADHSRILTTPHFNSYKYRPLNRAVNFLTYQVGDVNPEFFRAKNVMFHLLNVLLVYFLAWKLFGSVATSAVGALFFGLHPAANQTIIGAVDTNSMSHAAFLAALLMLMRSVDGIRQWALWLTASIFVGWLSLLAYDSNIVVFGLMFLWPLLNWAILGERFNQFRFVGLFVALTAFLLGFYFLLRHLYVPQGLNQVASALPSVGVMLKNTFMYSGSLLLPVDVVLANEWLNTPLPSEIQFSMSSAILIFALVSVIVIGVGFFFLRWLRPNLRSINYVVVIFLLFGMALPLLPVLFLQSHPSETYLYLPVAFYALLLSYGLTKILAEAEGSGLRSFYIPTLVVLIALFSSATWVRNKRVFECGQTARRILYELPGGALRAGAWKISFANAPGENTTRRYGFYGFRGVDTIGHGPIADRAITSALQLVYQNRLLTGEIVEPQQLLGKCRTGQQSDQICMWVHADGRLERLTAAPRFSMSP